MIGPGYDANLGRFIEVDPLEGGVDNDYGYVAEPRGMLDLDGRGNGSMTALCTGKPDGPLTYRQVDGQLRTVTCKNGLVYTPTPTKVQCNLMATRTVRGIHYADYRCYGPAGRWVGCSALVGVRQFWGWGTFVWAIKKAVARPIVFLWLVHGTGCAIDG